MRIPEPPRRRPAESIIPMINVVFLLLIFFLMTAEIAPPEPFPVTPPSSSAQTPAERGLTLYLGPDGRPGFEDATGDAALARLAARAAEAPGPLLIRADAAAPAAALARLMPRLATLGLSDIRLVTVPQ
ncbi:biopolymer transporter ExbD [Acidimangrovimonas pyrenivorans]|uniref:Biopolymer transporter ExbD n=1 Tax=Acidimangrovimonas pyrenivorans TaxID=2030798 RepID=A0ABV7AKC6_9RHOB